MRCGFGTAQLFRFSQFSIQLSKLHNLRLGTHGKLMAGGLDLAGLDVELTLKFVDRTERAENEAFCF